MPYPSIPSSRLSKSREPGASLRHAAAIYLQTAAVVTLVCLSPPALGQVQVPGAAVPTPTTEQLTIRREALRLIGRQADPGQRYLDNCIEPATIQNDLPGYEGVPVKRCVYRSGGLTSVVWSIMPSKDQLADWTVAACTSVPEATAPDCVRFLLDRSKSTSIWQQNSGTYIVKGFVNEAASGAGCGAARETVRVMFLHGVTVRESHGSNLCRRDRLSIEEQERLADPEAPIAYFIARPSSVSLAVVEEALGFRDGQLRGSSPIHRSRGPHPTTAWLDLNRNNYLAAYMGGVDQFMIYRVQAVFGKR